MAAAARPPGRRLEPLVVYHGGALAVHTRLKRVLVLVVGWAFLLLGIAGLFLPILQGILFMVVGLLILSSEYLWAHRVLGKLRARFPAVAHHAEEAASRAESWLKRISRRSSD